MDTFKSDLSIQVSNKLLDEPSITVRDINSKDEEGWRITDLVPSIKDTEYENQLIVENGKLKLKDGSTLPDTIQDIIKESLGKEVAGPGGNEGVTNGKYRITYNLDGGTATNVTEYTEETDTITLTNPTKAGYGFVGWTGSNGSTPQKIVKIEKGSTGDKTYTANWLAIEGTDVTKEMILANPSDYIGKSVTYTGYSRNTETIDWRLFGFDEAGNIMLKANNYILLSYKKNSVMYSPSYGRTNQYNFSSTISRTSLINDIGDSSNWNEYAVNGKTTARGAMTLPEFVNGYNLVNTEKLDAIYLTAGDTYPDSSTTASVDGYVIKKGDGNYSTSISGITGSYNGMNFYDSSSTKADGMWFASECSKYSEYLVSTYYNGTIYYGPYNDEFYGGLCPVVSLTGSALVKNTDGSLEVKYVID